MNFDLSEEVYIIWSRGSHTIAGGSRRGVFSSEIGGDS